MNYGLYVSAAGALTSLHRQDVVANNLANLNTVGFKPDSVFTKTRLPERLESGQSFADPQYLLEQLGGGQHLHPTFISFRQGDLAETHNDLDVAIMGEGFFAVQAGSGPDSIRLTRDGRFTLNTDGELVMSTSGMRVLDVNDEPIRLNRNASA
jgi:flagellar hook-basal body protein